MIDQVGRKIMQPVFELWQFVFVEPVLALLWLAIIVFTFSSLSV